MILCSTMKRVTICLIIFQFSFICSSIHYLNFFATTQKGLHSSTLFSHIGKSQIMPKAKMMLSFKTFFQCYTHWSYKSTNNVTLCETIHDACRSKKLIQILNRMGFCMSYNKLERIHMELASS